MAQMVVRNFESDVKTRLQQRAKRNGHSMEEEVRAIRSALAGGPFIFNLGHGVLPQTPPENVAALARLLGEPVDRT